MIVVAGIVNVETTVRVDGFPLEYAKTRFVPGGVTDRLGGVGFNVASGLSALGASVRLLTHLGDDVAGVCAQQELAQLEGLHLDDVVRTLATPRSTVLAGPDGAGAIFSDLKDAQEFIYPQELYKSAFSSAQHFHATNINWALPLAVAAKERGLPVSTDVQALADPINDAYNARFLEVADVVLFSGENLLMSPEEAIAETLRKFSTDIAVCTLGRNGVVAQSRGGRFIHMHPSRVSLSHNATGAGDAFAAGFLWGRCQDMSLEEALRCGQETAGRHILGSDAGNTRLG